ncbi:MAG: DMT family transporter [Archaeoglobus sp.]|nr:DMT family transporter [Archaeoglobus sp.]
MKRIQADALLLFVALIWGLTFPVIKIALESVAPLTFNTIRFFIAAVLFLPFLVKAEGNRDDFLVGVKIGVAVFLGYTLQTIGLEFTTATNAGFITSTYVVFTPLIAFFLFRHKVSRVELTFLLIAFLGLYLLSEFRGKFNWGDFLVLLCAIAFATEIVLISHFSRLKSPTFLAFGQIVAVATFSAPIAFFEKKMAINQDVVVALLITAVFATTLARIAQNHAQKFTRPSDAAIIFSMEGVFSHLFAILMLGEKLSAIQYLGAGLIVLSVVAISIWE